MHGRIDLIVVSIALAVLLLSGLLNRHSKRNALVYKSVLVLIVICFLAIIAVSISLLDWVAAGSAAALLVLSTVCGLSLSKKNVSSFSGE